MVSSASRAHTATSSMPSNTLFTAPTGQVHCTKVCPIALADCRFSHWHSAMLQSRTPSALLQLKLRLRVR